MTQVPAALKLTVAPLIEQALAVLEPSMEKLTVNPELAVAVTV
jgi:hypothetical protein